MGAACALFLPSEGMDFGMSKIVVREKERKRERVSNDRIVCAKRGKG